MTRASVASGWNIPIVWLVPVIGIPVLLTSVMINPLWLALILPLLWIARRLSDDPDGGPRVSWIALSSGSTWATRKDGVEKVHPLEPTDIGLGVLHD